MKLLKKILHVKLAVFTFMLLPVVMFTLITSKTDRLGGIQSFVVLTGSMAPTIDVGSVIYTKSQQFYDVGDVIAFKSGQVTITHRVVEVVNENNTLSYRTQGDANNAADTDVVPASQVLGKATNSVPYVGRFIMTLKTTTGFVAFVIFPGLLFIAMELWKIKNEIVRQTEKKVQKQYEVLSF